MTNFDIKTHIMTFRSSFSDTLNTQAKYLIHREQEVNPAAE